MPDRFGNPWFFDPGEAHTDHDDVPYAVDNNGVNGTFGMAGDDK
jgi:hypothetical protein